MKFYTHLVLYRNYRIRDLCHPITCRIKWGIDYLTSSIDERISQCLECNSWDVISSVNKANFNINMWNTQHCMLTNYSFILHPPCIRYFIFVFLSWKFCTSSKRNERRECASTHTQFSLNFARNTSIHPSIHPSITRRFADARVVHQEKMLPKWIGRASVCNTISDEAADVLKKKTSEAEMIKKSFAVYTSAAAAVQKQTDQLQRIHKERGQSM